MEYSKQLGRSKNTVSNSHDGQPLGSPPGPCRVSGLLYPDRVSGFTPNIIQGKVKASIHIAERGRTLTPKAERNGRELNLAGLMSSLDGLRICLPSGFFLWLFMGLSIHPSAPSATDMWRSKNCIASGTNSCEVRLQLLSLLAAVPSR